MRLYSLFLLIFHRRNIIIKGGQKIRLKTRTLKYYNHYFINTIMQFALKTRIPLQAQKKLLLNNNKFRRNLRD